MSFKAINWTPSEKVGEAKMDAMAENAQWLYLNTPRAIYTTSGGLRRVEGVRIVTGRVLVSKRKSDSATVQVRFGNFFSPRCDPIVTTGVISDAQTKIFCVVSGLGQLLPDSRGFNVGVNVAADAEVNDKISESFYVAWQAMGYWTPALIGPSSTLPFGFNYFSWRGLLRVSKRPLRKKRVQYYSPKRRAVYSKGDIIDHLLLFELYGWKCWLCEKPINRNIRKPNHQAATIDHVIPLCQGGTHTWDNLLPAHALCNYKKGGEQNQSHDVDNCLIM